MDQNKVKVGYGRADITPPFSVPLGGYGNNDQRMSQGALEPLYTTCLAISDGDSTVLVFTTDIICTPTHLLDDMRAAVHEATGVAKDHILFSATHTHAGPDQYSAQQCMKDYLKFFWGKLAEAGKAALDDLAPAQLMLGRTKTSGMNFVRHYKMADGSVAGDNFGSFVTPAVGHAAPADEQVQLAKLLRQGKKDILLFNWQAHPKLSSTISTAYGKEHRPYASPDYVGECRRVVEQTTGCLFAFWLGAAGNLNPLSKVETENPPVLEPVVYGQQVAQAFLGGLATLVPAKLDKVRLLQRQFKAQIDHTEDGLVENAKKVMALWKETNNFGKTREYGAPLGVMGAYHAGSILRRAADAQEREMELDALSVGDLAFVTAPYEMFCIHGNSIKVASPYPITFVLTLANGSNAYIADELAFTYGSYEVHNRTFVRGTGEALAREMVDMLNELHREG